MTFYNSFFPPISNFNTPSFHKLNTNVDNLNSIQEKNNCKSDSNQNHLCNLFNETDTLLILSIIYLLYNQKEHNFPLIFCLFLLLLD